MRPDKVDCKPACVLQALCVAYRALMLCLYSKLSRFWAPFQDLLCIPEGYGPVRQATGYYTMLKVHKKYESAVLCKQAC